MTYEEIFSKAKELLTSGSTEGFNGDFAVQINITGEGEGIFYIAFKNGALAVEPYDTVTTMLFLQHRQMIS